MQNGVQFQRQYENVCLTCPTTITSEASHAQNVYILPRNCVRRTLNIREANIMKTTQKNDDDTCQKIDDIPETSETSVNIEDECPYCDESGRSLYDSEFCLACNGTHRLQRIDLSP